MPLVDLFAGQITNLENPALWLTDAMGAPRSAAGVNVTHQKADGMSAYFACAKVLGEDVGKLPMRLYKTRADGRGKDKADSHPVHKLMHSRPSPEMLPFVMKDLMIRMAATWGNAYAEIQRTRTGRPYAIYPIHPSRVKVQRDADGDIVYLVRVEDTKTPAPASMRSLGNVSRGLLQWLPYKAADIIHIKGPGDDGIVGKSVLRAAADALGISLAAQEFGGNFFANGTHIAGVLQHPGSLGPEAAKTLRESWVKRHSGSKNANRPAVLEEGMTWSPIGIPPGDAQFLETRQFQNIEVCRFFRMPPHKIQELGRATWANIESQNIEYVGDTLMPWLVRFQEEANAKLLTQAEQDAGYFLEFVLQALLMGDSTTRGTFYKTLFNMGAISRNEIRSFERLNPVEDDDGGTYYMQLNMSPVDKLGQDVPAPAAAQESTPPPSPPPSNAARAEELQPLFRRAAEQALRRESDMRAHTLDAYNQHAVYMRRCFAEVSDVLARGDSSTTVKAICDRYCYAQSQERQPMTAEAMAAEFTTQLLEAIDATTA